MKVLYRYQLYYDLVPDPETVDESMFIANFREVSFKVVEETKATYLFYDLKGNIRRVLKGAVNSYAHDNKDKALKCFYHRTMKHKNIMIGKSKCLNLLLKKVLQENQSIIYKKINYDTRLSNI
jgi:hypothetical protein